jgi:hypothetical protein
MNIVDVDEKFADINAKLVPEESSQSSKTSIVCSAEVAAQPQSNSTQGTKPSADFAD